MSLPFIKIGGSGSFINLFYLYAGVSYLIYYKALSNLACKLSFLIITFAMCQRCLRASALRVLTRSSAIFRRKRAQFIRLYSYLGFCLNANCKYLRVKSSSLFGFRENRVGRRLSFAYYIFGVLIPGLRVLEAPPLQYNCAIIAFAVLCL